MSKQTEVRRSKLAVLSLVFPAISFVMLFGGFVVVPKSMLVYAIPSVFTLGWYNCVSQWTLGGS